MNLILELSSLNCQKTKKAKQKPISGLHKTLLAFASTNINQRLEKQVAIEKSRLGMFELKYFNNQKLIMTCIRKNNY
jgi:hypothetical protein